MARAYPNLVSSFEKVSPPMVETFSQCELDEPGENRMINLKKTKTIRKRKA
jgi:hypothetical protein